MGQVSPCLRRVRGGFAHWCPGCEEIHVLPDGWSFNGDLEAPTFSPSFKHSGKQRAIKDGQWTGEWVRDAAGNPVDWCCHYFLTKGELQFCGDSTHALAGRAVPLQALPAGFRDEVA